MPLPIIKLKKSAYNNYLKKLFKSYQLFQRLLLTRPELVRAIDNIWKQYGYPKRISYFHNAKNVSEMNRQNREIYNKRIQFVKALKKEGLEAFHAKIQSLLNSNKLGQEWFITVADFIMLGHFMPPGKDLDIQVKKINGREAAYIEIGPETSIDDFELAMPKIKELQKKLYPNYKKRNYSPKFYKHVSTLLGVAEAKDNSLLLEDVITGQKHIKTVADIMSDLYISSNDISIKADKRRANNYSQTKRRIKK